MNSSDHVHVHRLNVEYCQCEPVTFENEQRRFQYSYQ